MREYKPVKPPTGPKKTCKTWAAEAAMRMMMNNLSEEIAEKPEELIIYGGTGKAARNWECYDAIVKSLKKLEEDETLLVQSGKPVGVFRTFPDAPRVLIANSHIVPQWASWENFRELERLGLTMFGQMTAGSWIYIGTQGIVQGTYETFSAAADKHFEGDLSGKLLVSGGLGGMGGAQPLAATMAGATFLGADVDKGRIKRRIDTGYCDQMTDNVQEAIKLALEWKEEGKARSICVIANIVDLLTELVNRNVTPDILTDQTSAHDELNGYVPRGVTLEEAGDLRGANPDIYVNLSLQTMAEHVRLMLQLKDRGAITFDYGNNLRGQAHRAGLSSAFDYPGFVPEYVRPLFCEGKGPFRWVALSGDPEDIRATDKAALELFPKDKILARWLKLAAEKIKFQGLPSRICWLGYGDRAKFGLKINEMVKSGEIKAPIVIGRDHLDGGSVASPHRETESMKDSSDVIADWPILNGLLNAVSGASWVSIHHGGGVGIGQSIHAGLVIVADGTDEAAARLERVLTNDPGTGVMRHADAGYEKAVECAKERGVKIPMLPGKETKKQEDMKTGEQEKKETGKQESKGTKKQGKKKTKKQKNKGKRK